MSFSSPVPETERFTNLFDFVGYVSLRFLYKCINREDMLRYIGSGRGRRSRLVTSYFYIYIYSCRVSQSVSLKKKKEEKILRMLSLSVM